jgi:hypothetical protein
MPLYYVADDGPVPAPRDWDLFVRAKNPSEAVTIWRRYYDTEESPHRIDEIPAKPKHGAICWKDVPCVWLNSK